MLGRRRPELAEVVLKDFFQERDVFQWELRPGGTVEEAEDRSRGDDEDENLAGELDSYFVPLARLHADREFLSAFHAKQYRFRAVLGDKVRAPFQNLRTIQAEIVVSASILAHLAKTDVRKAKGHGTPRELSTDKREEDLKRREKHEARVWCAGEEEDEIARRLERIESKTEDVCRPAIEARPT